MTKIKKGSQEETETIAKPVVLETATTDLRSHLEELKQHDEVIGYILRNSHSASIDVKDPTKIVDYAMLSSSALDAAEELSELFNLGEFKKIVIEGVNVKVLSFIDGDNRVSVFLEKNADISEFLKKLRIL
ncbi:MAG: hypothetical protein ACPLW5_03230 [Candidatus Bathyarchaeales archaeon]